VDFHLKSTHGIPLLDASWKTQNAKCKKSFPFHRNFPPSHDDASTTSLPGTIGRLLYVEIGKLFNRGMGWFLRFRINPVERASSALEQADDRMRGAQGTKRSFKMEIRLVQDFSERPRRLEGRLQKMDQELRTLQADFRALQAEEDRGERRKIEEGCLLVVPGSGGGGGPDGEIEREVGPTQAGNNLFNEAAALQDKTQNALSNTKNMMIAASKEVGVSTLEELQRQREVIQTLHGA
jgi:hypothetical protein